MWFKRKPAERRLFLYTTEKEDADTTRDAELSAQYPHYKEWMDKYGDEARKVRRGEVGTFPLEAVITPRGNNG